MAVVSKIPDPPYFRARQALGWKKYEFCNSLNDLSTESINLNTRIWINRDFSNNRLVSIEDGDIFIIPKTEKEFINDCFTKIDPYNHKYEGVLLNCINDKGIIETKAIFFEFLKRQLFPYRIPIPYNKEFYFPIHSNGNVYDDLEPCPSGIDIARYIIKNKLGNKLRVNSLLEVQVGWGREDNKTEIIHCFDW